MGRREEFWQYCFAVFARYLPPSHVSMLAKKIRYFFAARIIRDIGSNVNIERGCRFSSRVRIGKNSGIGVNCDLQGYVNIGQDVMMGPEVAIYSNNHAAVTTDVPMISQGMTEHRPVVIADDVWIGRRVIILPGVTIGRGSIIGAGAVVTKNIPGFSIAAGNPAKVIRSRLEC